MHAGIQGSKLVVISDAGHSPHQTHAKRVVEEITSFLA
jgi:pimeloyl-ACP methyl ester carboxylesterase